VHDVLDAHLAHVLVTRCAPGFDGLAELLARLSFAVAQLGGLFELLSANGFVFLLPEFLDLALLLLELRRTRHRGDSRPRARLIHHVDRLVGKKPVR